LSICRALATVHFAVQKMYKDPSGSEYHAFQAGIKFNKLRGINEGAEFNSSRLHLPSREKRAMAGARRSLDGTNRDLPTNPR
jgi:hypothetical protein